MDRKDGKNRKVGEVGKVGKDACDSMIHSNIDKYRIDKFGITPRGPTKSGGEPATIAATTLTIWGELKLWNFAMMVYVGITLTSSSRVCSQDLTYLTSGLEFEERLTTMEFG